MSKGIGIRNGSRNPTISKRIEKDKGEADRSDLTEEGAGLGGRQRLPHHDVQESYGHGQEKWQGAILLMKNNSPVNGPQEAPCCQ